MSAQSEQFREVFATNFLNYAIKAISDRAIPAVQDGLKPVQRRILWLMWTSRMLPSSNFKKSIRVVGDVLGKYHPHSDGSVYMALVNLTSEYTMSELIDTQGNFGTRREDSPASSRYTECRLHRNATKLLLSDLDERCIGFHQNFDQTLEEPDVLPAKVPVLLLNGTFGIAVGIASSIPSHNLGEVTAMCRALLRGDVDDAYKHFIGPDWKSGGRMFLSEAERRKIFEDGRGSLELYGKMSQVPPTGRNKVGEIHVHELPWKTPRQVFIDQLLKLRTEVPDLKIFRSSNPDEPIVRILTKTDLDRLENLIFLKTKFSTSYTYNSVFLNGKEPIQGGIKTILELWLDFRRQTVSTRSQLKYDKTTAEIEFLSARNLLVTEFFDEFLIIIRKDGRDAAAAFLKASLHVNESIIDRLLSLRISSLSKESSEELLIKIESLTKDAERYHALATNPVETDKYIDDELVQLAHMSPARHTEPVDKKISVSTRLADVLTRKIVSSDGKTLTLGTGQRMTTSESCVMITPNETYRLRIRELKAFRDGATIDPATLRPGVKAATHIALTEKFALIVYKSGRALWLNLDMVRQSSAIRKLTEKGPVLKVFLFNEISEDFLFSLTKDDKAVAVRLSDLPIAARRAVAKLRLQSVPLKDLLLVPEDTKIIVSFKKGLQQSITPVDFYHNTFSIRAKRISPSKVVSEIEVDAPAN